MLDAGLNNLRRKAQLAVQQDPRKAGILAALLVILGFMLVRQLMNLAGAPNVAHATHSGLRVDDRYSAAQVAPRVSRASGAPVVGWLQQPPAMMGRNLFAVRYELFPPEVTKPGAIQDVQGFWDEIAKSLTDQVDQQEKKQEMLQTLQSQASALQVASVMMGPAPRAIINDKLVGEGDVVAGFRVHRIEARRIIVEREGIRLEIQMK